MLKNVPRRHARLWLVGESIVPRSIEIEELDLQQPLLLTVARPCRVRIVADGAASDTEVHFESGDGRSLWVTTRWSSGFTSAAESVKLDRAATALLILPETAATMVWTQHGREIVRERIRLHPDRVTVLRG